MSGPAIIPGKRFSPWRYFMNSFSVVGLWFWLTGIAFGIGAGTQDGYLMLASLAAASLGVWPAVAWELEREKKEDLPRRIVAQVDEACETLDLDRRIVLSGIRRIAATGLK